MSQILEFLLEAVKWTGTFALTILAIFIIGLIFTFVVTILLMAIYLAVSCAYELYDIYIKQIFNDLRRKRKERNG